uniref:Ankyrin repeat domain 32 n=1 Tax=Nothobranchius rachovii TaxID=451742 RepID=A0A1A8N6Y5_9TELE
MESCRHIFQISGIKNCEKKRILLKGINQLGGKYIGGSVYKHCSTHLIIPQVLPGEKFLAFCAAGKWVVTPKYVLDSVKNGSWLDERSYEVAIFTRSSAAFYPVRQWREKVTNGRITGAFQGWRVLLMVQEPTRRDMFRRLLKAGRAEVYNSPPSAFTTITHVMAKPATESSKSQDAPCYPVSHIVQHLFGSYCVDMKFNIQDHLAEKDNYLDEDYSNLEAELKSVVIEKEGQPRLRFLQFLGYHDPHHPHSQAILADFSNVGTMIECGLFVEALDSIRSSAFPGLLPPATYLISLLQYAQQGNATSVFLRNFHQVLENLLLTNPPWLAPNSVKKYYALVLQCPQCSVLLRQTDEKGRSPMDLVSTLGQREELFSSAEVGDSTQRHEGAEVLNLPLLEAGSCLLCHLVVSYQLERGLPGLSLPIDKPNSLVYKLVRALETHPLQKVTLDWTDQRAVRLVEDVEMLLELSQGKHQEQVSRAVRECKGESTTLLMEILENLRSRGEMLVADL